MANKLPYLPSPGTVPKVFDKITEARTPERFTGDFLETKLGFKGGNARPIIPLLKRLKFLSDDGVPTELYAQFRTESGRGAAMAQALRNGYDELFDRNEYVYELDRNALKDIAYSITGAEKGNSATELMISTFLNLKEYADFDASDDEREKQMPIATSDGNQQPKEREEASPRSERPAFGLGYTININLPETTDVNVYNAIFEAIDKKLLR